MPCFKATTLAIGLCVLIAPAIAEPIRIVGDVGTGSWKWRYGVVAGDATSGYAVYGIPDAASEVLKVGLGSHDGTVTTLGHLGTGKKKWWCGVVAANGKIYGLPANANNVLKIDPAAGDAVSTFGTLMDGSWKYPHGVLAPNGIIYGMPGSATSILRIDPATDTISTFTNVGYGSHKYWHSIVAANGAIYGIPYSARSVLKVNVTSESTTMFGNFGRSSGEPFKWRHGVLAADGQTIYGMPANADRVLRIDTGTDEASLTGPDLSTMAIENSGEKWRHGVLAGNGAIYGIPFSATKVLKIDPSGGVVTTIDAAYGIGHTYSSMSHKWSQGVVAANGLIYGLPAYAPEVLRIDPETDTVTTFGDLEGGMNKWRYSVSTPDGKIVGLPYDATSVLRLDPADDTTSTSITASTASATSTSATTSTTALANLLSSEQHSNTSSNVGLALLGSSIVLLGACVVGASAAFRSRRRATSEPRHSVKPEPSPEVARTGNIASQAPAKDSRDAVGSVMFCDSVDYVEPFADLEKADDFNGPRAAAFAGGEGAWGLRPSGAPNPIPALPLTIRREKDLKQEA